MIVNAFNRAFASGGNVILFAKLIPSSLWPGAVEQRVVEMDKVSLLALSTRAGLLEMLAASGSSFALPLALEWTSETPAEGPTSPLYSSALYVRLSLQPNDAWPLVESECHARGIDALRDLTALWERRGEFGAKFAGWSTVQLIGLLQMLTEALPAEAEEDPRLNAHAWWQASDELKQLRGMVTNLLLERQLDDHSEAYASLLESQPLMKERHEWSRQQREAARLLGGLAPKSEDAQSEIIGLSVEQAVRALEETDYRLMRSADDLLAAVVNVLRHVEQSAPYDVSMLYGRAEQAEVKGDARAKKGRASPRPARRHLDEDALQAYVRRRLEDLLPSRIPDVQIKTHREPQVKYQRRFDVEVTAPTIDRQLATVVIEIKWSDNHETKTGISTQLVDRYLIAHKLRHGIYLVGWCGRWHSSGASSSDITKLTEHLASSVKAITSHEKAQQLKLAPVVLDLRWRDDDI